VPSITTDDGVRLSYAEHGDPTGRPVVLIAGFKAPATSWKSQQQAFGAAGYRVLSLDRRGHGLSDRPAFGATMARHGADVGAFLAELDLRDVVLVGGSMGGNTIWAYLTSASSDGGADRLRGIVIVDQTPKMLNSADWPYGFYGYDESNRDTLFAETVPDPGRVSLRSKGVVRIGRLVRALGGGERRRLTDPEKQLLKDHAVADWRPVIADVDVPVLFVAGRESEFWPAEHAAAAAALGWSGSSVVLEKAGHAANIEQPRRFNEEVLRYLASL